MAGSAIPPFSVCSVISTFSMASAEKVTDTFTGPFLPSALASYVPAL